MTRVAVVAMVLASTAARAEEGAEAPGPAFRLHVGGQLGAPFIAGVTAVGTFLEGGRVRFVADAAWETSATLQSYGVGGAWQVLDRAFYVGGRLRLVQFQPPWAPAGNEPWLGLGPELGLRLRVGPHDKGLLHLALHATFVPAQATNLATLVGLTLGFGWSVFER